MSLSATIGSSADFLGHIRSKRRRLAPPQSLSKAKSGGDTVGGENVEFNYDASGQTTGESFYQSTGTSDLVAQESTVFDDAAGRLSSMTYAKGGTTLDSFAYTYDSANQVYSYNDAEFGNEGSQYTYDASGQLLTASPLSGGETATIGNTYSDSYDPNGNAATINGWQHGDRQRQPVAHRRHLGLHV